MSRRLNVGDPAPEVRLLDTDGQVVRLADYWKNGPTLLNFLRHFG